MDRTVHIRTFGCQMNKLDSALIKSSLELEGFKITDSVKKADVVLYNTCSVRQHAEARVISHLGHLKHIKKSKPELIVGIIGCMAQRLGEKLFDNEVVNIVCGPSQIPKIPQLIKESIKNRQKELAVTEKIRRKTTQTEAGDMEEFESVYGTREKNIPSQAFIRVMRGCNNFCSYCIVPYVRGPEACRQPKAIIEQIKRLADNGIKQVTLLGQTVNSYKYKQDGRIWSLADLLAEATNITGIEWLKFVTSYPSEEFLEDIMNVMAQSPKVCKYLHIPAQSGSDKILQLMNRNYTSSQYLELLDKARAIVPDIAIAGDFIVGFPGETEKDFQETIDLAKKAEYKNSFIFKYSPRPGTISDKRLEDNISDQIKQQRNIELLAVQEKISEKLSNKLLGRNLTVLVEGFSKKHHQNSQDNNTAPQLVGRTSTEYIVVFNGPTTLTGQFVQVSIVKTSPLTLFGQITCS